jgi:cellulose synthase/poly-beta-1,6-N-acetylglucosamine synthase-like glycosyltransferase
VLVFQIIITALYSINFNLGYIDLIKDFSYFLFVIPTYLFPNLSIDVILLSLPFLAILSCWIYLLNNLFHSYHIIKSTLIKKNLVNNIDYKSKDDYPYVSIIIPARNEQDNIERSLIFLMEQNYPNVEIIAVDDNSTDNTLFKMKNIQQNTITIKNKKNILY